MHYDVINIDFIMMDYYWTPELRDFVGMLTEDAPSLIFLVGLQGSGKTSALRAIEEYLSGKAGAYYWRWDGELPEDWEHIRHFQFFLIESPRLQGGVQQQDGQGLGRDR